MLLLALGIYSNPSIQRGPSVSQAEQAHLNCRPILSDETRTGFENPSSRRWRMDGNTIGSQQDEPTWEIPFLNSVSGTGQATNASRFWRFSKPTLLVQKAVNTTVTLFSDTVTMQLPFADPFLQDCKKEQQLTSVLGLLGNPQLTGAAVQQNDTPVDTVQAQSDEKTGAETKLSTDDQPQARMFVGTVIDEEGANLRSGPGLDYVIVDKWAKGQQFPFEMVSADGEWLRINEGLWISASIVAGQEISQTPSPAYVDSPEHPVPIIKASDLGQRVASQEGDRIFLGAVSVREGANIRSGPGLEHEIVSPVSFGSLIAWVAMSEDREWLDLQHGHWISADLVAESKVYRIINTDGAIGPVDGIPVTNISREPLVQTQGTGYIATVISETGAGIRSGPGFEYAVVFTIPQGLDLVYMAQSENGEWLLLEDGNWIAAFQVSTQGFDGTYAVGAQEETSVPSSAEGLEMEESTEPSMEMLALRQQAYEFINKARTSQGLSPVRLGDNQAANQLAADMIMHRNLSDWTMAGHSPAMLYTLAGGEGYQQEISAYAGYYERTDCLDHEPAALLLIALEHLMTIPVNHEAIHFPEHTTVNVGISFSCTALAVQLVFEGEYVSYLNPPTIQNGQLTMEGRLLNGANMVWIGEEIGIWINYLPSPVPLTRGQLFRRIEECRGIPVAAILTQRPMFFSSVDIEKGFETNTPRCLSPSAFNAQSEPPQNEEEAAQLLRAVFNVPLDHILETHSGPIIIPEIWKVNQNRFTVQADVSSILAEHGPGVYMINLVGSVNSNSMYISKYAVFVD